MKNNILNNQYDFIFSIGEACSCSSILRLCNLQNSSYPLDWLYGSTFETRVNLLLTNFQDFINKDDLKFVGQRVEPEPCDIYANPTNGIVFNHDFPLNGNLDNDYDEVSAKYKRRIDRLYEHIGNANKILLVYLQAPNRRKKDCVAKEQLREEYEKIQKLFPQKNISILCLKHKVFWFNRVKHCKISPHISLVTANYRNKDKTTESFVVDNDALKKIFANIRLSTEE